MKRSLASIARKALHQAVRTALALLPRTWRFAFFRNLIDCDDRPDARLELKIADTQDELEACFRILHDAYVAAGFMQPDPSGLRVTIYHALPTPRLLRFVCLSKRWGKRSAQAHRSVKQSKWRQRHF